MSVNDNYDRNKLLKMVSDIFGEKKTKKELNEYVALWELADSTTDSKILSELSVSKYLEVREAVAYNPNTPVDVLIALLRDESCEVRQTAVLNPNLSLNEIEKLCEDESELVRDAVVRRKNKA